MCCFCGLDMPIEKSTILTIYPNYNSDEAQNIFSHKKCLRERLQNTIPLHPDLLED